MKQLMKQVTIRLDETILQTVREIANRRNVSAAAIIREALRNHVAKSEQQDSDVNKEGEEVG